MGYNQNMVKFHMDDLEEDYTIDHHGIFVAKILHLIFLINNGQNCSNYIHILWPHFLYNPPFIGVEISRILLAMSVNVTLASNIFA